MALDPCVTAILCELGNNVLAAINDIFETQKDLLTAQLAAIQAQLVIVNIATVPVIIARDAAQAAADEALSITTLVPFQDIQGCEDIGLRMESLRETIEETLASVNNFLNDANRKLAFQAELEAAQQRIQEEIDAIEEFQLELEICND